MIGMLPAAPEPGDEPKPLVTDAELPDDPTILVYVDLLPDGQTWRVDIPSRWIIGYEHAGQLPSIVDSLLPELDRHRVQLLFDDVPFPEADDAA